VHSVVMCHIPPFCWNVEEQDTNFNWPKGKREMWLDEMLKADVRRFTDLIITEELEDTTKGLR